MYGRLFAAAFAAIGGAISLCAATPVVSEVKDFGGAPAIWIDGKPSTGAMHWNRGMTEADVAAFRDAGVHLYSFMGAPPMPDPSGAKTTYENDFPQLTELSDEFLDETLSMIERTDPAAKVLLRLRLTTPDWWRKAHEGECVKAYSIPDGKYEVRPWASPASALWRAEMEKAIRRVIRHCEKKWSHLVFGYHPGLCCCAENAIDWSAAVVDYSDAMARSYGKPLPDPERYISRNHNDTRRLLDPKKDADAVAFQRHLSRTMADAACFVSHVVKDELKSLGRTKVCGAFYGYFCLPANGTSSLNAAHQDFKRVLDSADIDFIAAPIDYGARQSGGAAIAQTLPASIALHGKFYYGEEDTRYHTAKGLWSCISGSAETSEPILRRNFLAAFSQGGIVWWMDLFAGGWYSKDRNFTLSGVGDCRKFADSHLGNRRSVAEIALFVSERSIDYDRVAPLLSYTELVGRQLCEVASVGAPYDVFLLEDLPLLAKSGRLAQYKLAMLMNASAPEPELRAAVRDNLCRDGRTVIFAGTPGFVSGRSSGAKFASEFTGIDLALAPSRDSGIVEAFVDGRRISYGTVRKSDPSLAVNDADAEHLAWYVEGSLRNTPGKSLGVAVAAKRLADHRAVVSLVNFMPSDLIRRFAEEAGVHVYSPHGDQVFAGPGWFAVAAKMPGRHRLAARNGKRFEVDMKRGEVKVFEF